MPGFDGNGNYVRYHNWTADAANLININAGEMDQEDSGFASAFGNCITRDGQGKATADLNPNVTNSYNLGTVGLAWATLNGIPVSRLTSAGAGDIRNYAAVSGTDCATAVTNSASANKLVIIPAGTWPMAATPTIAAGVIVQALPGATFSGAGATALGFTVGALQQEIDPQTTGTDFAAHYFRRNVTHAGGTPGFVSSCVRAETWVNNAAATNYEWALTAVMHNQATGGQNVAAYLLGNRDIATAGPTWGAVIDVEETIPVNNPTTGLVGLEVDNRSNGTDINNARIGLDVACVRRNLSGVDTQTGYGVRVQNGRDGTHSYIGIAFGIDSSTSIGIGFDTSIATIVQSSLKLAQGQNIAFDNAANNLLLNQGFGLDYTVGGVLQTRLMKTGGLQVLSSQVVGARSTGWNAMTGASDNATVFNTASVSLAQLASRVNALQAAFTAHGLIGLT